MLRSLAAFAFVVALAGLAMSVQDSSAARGQASRSMVWAPHGMVCAAQPLAAQAGLEVLKAGGSAVDAAIAVNACLGLMEPTANGMGGDLFAIVWDPRTRKLHGLNACGRSPFGLEAAQIPPEKDGTIPLYSPYAWSVPGCVDGWAELHAKFGKLPLARVLEPAIHYAESGFPLSPVIAGDWERSTRVFKDKPGFAEVFMPGGRAPREGETFRNPALAKTLRMIAQKGRDAYYRGPIAEALVRYSKANGGFFALEDFAKHRSEWIDPVSTNYHGVEVWELPPPGQGIAALQLLNLIENFDLKAMGRESADYWHVFTEAKKIAFADRARYYADPEFARVPVAELISKPYAKQRAAAIDMNRAATADVPGDPVALNRRETTYLCTADANGMMVSLIQSNYTGFGSGYVVPELGFGLQDRGNLFDLQPGKPNSYAPGKRPFHTIIPAFLTRDGAPLMAFGLMGGDMQPQGHAQIVVNLIDFEMNLQEAGDAIRFHHSGSSEPTGTTMKEGGVLHIEDGLPAAVLTELKRRGHRIEPESVGSYGGYQAIWRDPKTGAYGGATEKRKDGCAVGY
ncbi:MAG: gamma-glutamyltransferase [Candidatus Eisenbacteria bacterium]|uniref:Glutathione hydrolase proenzyme n=1 Tax=Eiseniibacteriota bacterium TaxID=2212470 RepID=A0A849SUA3_UNCEI|nr:gamma-glutamyltransferase [Candidatus Eisenbacteria bacterium]